MASFLVAALTSSSPGGLLTRQDALGSKKSPRGLVLSIRLVDPVLSLTLFTHKPGRCSSFSSVPVIKLPDRKLLREEGVYLDCNSRSQPLIVGKSRWELKPPSTGKGSKRMQAWTFGWLVCFPCVYGSTLCLGNGTTHNEISLLYQLSKKSPTDIPTR